MKTFLLYIFDSQIQDYRSLRVNLPYRKIRVILKQTLSPQQWRYFLANNQCYCTQRSLQSLGYQIKSLEPKPFLKQISSDDYPLFLCTFCFQTHYGIYFFNFRLFYDRCKGKLAKILQNLQTHLFVPLHQEERDFLIKVIAPKRLTARSLNPNSIQKLLKHSFSSFVCLAHHFKRIPHIQEIINRNFCFDDPFFCYWFLCINNQDPNDTKACNLLLNQDISSLCNQINIHPDSYHILNNQEILKLASKEVFEIGDGKIEVTLSTYDY